jgi:predicted DCC family thiol-disulfide oxidoreductase YuxK
VKETDIDLVREKETDNLEAETEAFMNPENHQTSSLPDSPQNPDADLVLYDGRCVFCTRSVHQLRKFDGKNRLAFVSIHDPLVAERFPDLSLEQLMEQMYVIPHSNPHQRYGGAAAIRYLSRRLPKLWLLAPLLHIPFSMPLWQYLYRQVARRRYRLAKHSGECDESGTCELHFEQKSEK